MTLSDIAQQIKFLQQQVHQVVGCKLACSYKGSWVSTVDDVLGWILRYNRHRAMGGNTGKPANYLNLVLGSMVHVVYTIAWFGLWYWSFKWGCNWCHDIMARDQVDSHQYHIYIYDDVYVILNSLCSKYVHKGEPSNIDFDDDSITHHYC